MNLMSISQISMAQIKGIFITKQLLQTSEMISELNTPTQFRLISTNTLFIWLDCCVSDCLQYCFPIVPFLNNVCDLEVSL